jgi:ATP-dependent Clp protease ATP-binding subunit ClpB
MERLSLKSDYDSDEESSKKTLARDEAARLEKLEQEIEELQKEQEALNTRWMREKGGVDKIKQLKENIGQVKFAIEKAEREFDLNRAAELKYAELPPLEVELQQLEGRDEDGGVIEGERMLRDEVLAEDIANVVAVWTGIPPGKLLDSERDKVLNMGDKLRERVVGQDEAIEIVTEAVQRSRAGLNDPSKPIASMIFLGPTGKLSLQLTD